MRVSDNMGTKLWALIAKLEITVWHIKSCASYIRLYTGSLRSPIILLVSALANECQRRRQLFQVGGGGGGARNWRFPALGAAIY